jgi:CRISPR-associated protein Cmr2
VAQARRARDLWCGSYLLSYLAGRAMNALESAHGEVVFPDVKGDPMTKAIKAEKNGMTPPDRDDHAARIGSLPNRFKAIAEDAPEAAKVATTEMQKAWKQITDKAWGRFKERTNGLTMPETKVIWDRQVQIKNQWEIAWVVGDNGSLLDQRKNLRSHFSKEEPGEKCTLCGERQALSSGKEDNRKTVRAWWGKVAQSFNGKRGFHFLKEGRERLCAICTIKRIFPLVAKKAIGWEVYHNYPSTSYMCAVDWLKDVLIKGQEEAVGKAIDRFIRVAEAADVPYDEEATNIAGISSLLVNHPRWAVITKLRGDVFFSDSIKNKNDFPVNDETKREELLEALSALTKAVDVKPTPFYALLIMDGDNMGRLLSQYPNEQSNISKALADFTSHVAEIVEKKHDGKLLYGGGDDVFAMLPLDTALSCTKELRETYIGAFQKHVPGVRGGTISAGIVYAHMNTALRAVVKDAHSLLDKVAKDALGRDAFAVRVWKRGGPILTFGKKWVEKDWVEELLQTRDALNNGEFASGFFYRFRELIPILETLSKEQKIQLLTAEYLKSREKLGLPDDPSDRRKEAEKRVEKFLELSLYPDETVGLKPDAGGPLFIRFLVEKEV